MANRNKISAQTRTTQLAVSALQSRNLTSRKWSVARQIEFICSCTSVAEVHAQLEPTSPVAQLYFLCLHGQFKRFRQPAEAALRALAACRTEVLTCAPLLPAVAALCRHYEYRRRELADWQPRRRNAYHQLYDLVRYLFDEFGDVPGWLVEAWATGQLVQNRINVARLTVHAGSGATLRSFSNLPVPLSRRQEHQLRQAPCELTLVGAVRYAQLADLGALALLKSVLSTPMGQHITPDDAFWLTVVAFFRDAPMADPWQFGPVCTWIDQVRTVGLNGEPPRPGFSLKGRQMASVLAQTAAWHRNAQRELRYWGPEVDRNAVWPGLPVISFELDGAKWVQITQLLSYSQLLEEGSVQQNCVASYGFSCRLGRCGIFSLRVNGTRTLTVEVRASRQIVQVRGRFNRLANEVEWQWLRQWAAVAGLSIPVNIR